MEKSENESEKQETVEDVVAEMRRGTKLPGYWRSCDLNEILKYHADRIEAARRREKSEIETNALAVGGIVEAERHKECGTPKEVPMKSLNEIVAELRMGDDGGDRLAARRSSSWRACVLGHFAILSAREGGEE